MTDPTQERFQTVLLVDDDPVARVLTSSVLESHGLRVVEVSCGCDAVVRFKEARPACVILDAMMPDLDGFETCEQLRRLPGGEHVPILMLTGLDDEQSVARAYEVGATDFFVKSQQWTLLAQRVRYLLRAAHTREELEHSRAKLAKAQHLARLGSWEWNFLHKTIYFSPEIVSMLNMPVSSRSISQDELHDLLVDGEQEKVDVALRQLLKTKQPQSLELRMKTTDGTYLTMQCEAEIEKSHHGVVSRITGTLQDITQRKEQELKIRALANFDTLTNLVNRRCFNDRFTESIRQADRHGWQLALLFIDLDRFKQVNDTQGHSAGDALLLEVAQRLTLCVRRHREQDGEIVEDFVARFGGDEFAVLLNRMTDNTQPQIIAERILEQLRQPFVVNGVENFISASIGIAVFPEHGRDVDTLVKNADAAMYSIKALGRNNVRRYQPELSLANVRRWEIEKDLHKALERGELELYYQPQVDTRQNRIVGVEALMRWHRHGRVINPQDFIPLALENGLIVPMGEWTIHAACRQIRQWRVEGLGDIAIAVNIPSVHIQRGNLLKTVHEALVEHEIPRGLLELEITESTLMHDLTETIDILTELSKLGVRLAVDDFGTGYSSLAYLKRFPIDCLKIDESFIRDLTVGSENEAIVQAIIALARALKLDVVAEGIETRDQAMLLDHLGCCIMQGYWFARPQSASNVTQLMRQPLSQPAVPRLPGFVAREASDKGPALRVLSGGNSAR